jgi:prepilin-type N-terminal cleavage/methylation domain-containing protein
MKRAKRIYGFTLLEMLTAMAIIAVMIGLLIPAIGKIQTMAQTVKQKAQFNAIEVALEAFRSDSGYNDYPPSSYTRDSGQASFGTDGYCGAQKLAEAIVGLDGFGFHPKSQWRSDGMADVDGDTIPELIYDVVNGIRGSATGTTVQSAADNLKARKGPYLELEKANAVKLSNMYPYPSVNGEISEALADTFVLCDMFGQVKNKATGKRTGMPILYFRANTSNTLFKPSNLTLIPFDTSQDAVYNINENYPFLSYWAPWGSGVSHLMTDRNIFYQRIANPNFTSPQRPYRNDSFILLSAGPDGLYGTSDDVYNVDENDK